MMNNNLEAAWCGVRDGVSFYKLTQSAGYTRHFIRGCEPIHIYVERCVESTITDRILNASIGARARLKREQN